MRVSRLDVTFSVAAEDTICHGPFQSQDDFPKERARRRRVVSRCDGSNQIAGGYLSLLL
jgi:hypothetical protein